MIVSNLELFLMQEGRCFYCGEIMSHVRAHKTYKKKLKKINMGWTVDHFKPKCHGNGLLQNKVLCHSHCNSDKAAKYPGYKENARFHELYKRIKERHELLDQLTNKKH
jgi:5-methylcytosine-specific restriction endonuclease McrA